jgi:antirestriction protein ArdC
MEETATLRRDVYSIVTDRIIELLEKGTVPWKQPWTDAGLPHNAITRKAYHGINVWLLASLGYQSNYFLSFKQVKEAGGRIKQGERSHLVIYYKWIEKEDEKLKEIKKIPFLRYHLVYNIAQCEGKLNITLPRLLKPNMPLQACEQIVREMPNAPEIKHEYQQAYYNSVLDYINMPIIESFEESESYYLTLFHEMVHSTGHKSRLNRKEIVELNRFGSEPYSIEELTAEMGGSYLQSIAGIANDNFEASAAYIQGWLKRLHNDKRFIIYASTQAQKAVDYILNFPTEAKELTGKEEIFDESEVSQ